MTSPVRVPPAPKHLSSESKAWWRTIAKTFELGPHQWQTLQAACESWDRCQEARAVLAVDGLVVTTKYGEKRPHPCLALERDSRTGYLRALRELCLGDVDPPDVRPPRPVGRYVGRP